MRGGFVACLGDDGGQLERAAGRLRWHRGSELRVQDRGLAIAASWDPRDGPFVESTPSGNLLLTHGAAPSPVATLQAEGSRFVALQWDGAVLRVARDPIGLAPLFYRVTPRAVWLASELHALLGLGPDAPELAALTARAAFAPLDQETGWVGILRLLPGHALDINAKSGVRVTRYWDPSRRLGTYRGGWSDAVAELRERLRTAVERCCDERPAVVLSGGQDSSAVAVSVPLGRCRPELVHVHFAGLPRTHEIRYAQAVADHMGVPMHTVAGELEPWDIAAELDLHGAPYSWLPFGMDEPVYAHLESKGVGVALDGHDGDGVLGPQGSAWGALLLDNEFGRLGALCRAYGLRRTVRGVLADFVPPAFRRRARPKPGEDIASYFSPKLAPRIQEGDIERWRWPSRRWRMRQVQPLLPRAVISFEHKELEAARHGIDLRHPFADRELVEFLISLPCAAKADPVRTKSLMLEALAAELPPAIRERPKSGYLEVVRNRVDPAWCLETIRGSGVRLPHVDYPRLFEQGDADPERISIYLLVNLARVHEFARRAQ